jgi:hypothetical protein
MWAGGDRVDSEAEGDFVFTGKVLVWVKTDMRIFAGIAGTPEEPSKKNTLEIRFPFASK